MSLLLASACDARTRDTFDIGWAFQLGSSSTRVCNASTFPVPLNDVQCLGLASQPSATTASACEDACCAAGEGCTTWQYEAGAGCWIGAGCTTNLTGVGWVGAAELPRPPLSPCDPGSPCDPAFNDSAWRRVNVPHDSAIEGEFNPSVDPSKGALAKNVSWYRKHFTVDSALEGSLIWLTFDGVFRAADVYVNGAFVAHHEEGYTAFVVYLHNASAPLHFGGGDNVVALFVDGTVSELWCYEGQGIYRHVWLETAGVLSFTPWSLFAPAAVTGSITGSDASAPQSTDGALIMPQVDVANAGDAPATGHVVFVMTDGAGAVVLNASSPFNVTARSGWQRVAPGPLAIGSASSPIHLWNIALSPPLYTITATLLLTGAGGTPVDSASDRIGVRSALFDARAGFLLNGVKVQLRGTSNHLGFGGLGMAAVDRVDEFRVATLASIGCNAFRTAHNPVTRELLDVADEYGMLVWSENRFITAGVQPVASTARGGPTTALAQGQRSATAVAARGSTDDRGDAQLFATPSAVPTADPRLIRDAQDMVLQVSGTCYTRVPSRDNN